MAAAVMLLSVARAVSGEQRASPLTPPPPPGGPWRLAWADEFDALNTSRWTVMHNGTHGDLEQQLYVSDAVAVERGHLVLRTARTRATGPDGKRTYNFTSGWVDTQGKQETQFGRWEIRARLPDPEARGIWPAHWLMPRFERGTPGDWNCWPVGGEIDIMESTGGIFNNTVLGTYHWGANCTAGSPPPPPGPNCTCGCGCDLHRLSNTNGQFECTHPDGDRYRCEKAHDFSKGFHVFAVEWEATSIRWFVDDKLYWTRTLGVDHVSFIPSQPLYIILNTAIQPAIVSNANNQRPWMQYHGPKPCPLALMQWNHGAGTVGTYPVEHLIDYVRVWEQSGAA